MLLKFNIQVIRIILKVKFNVIEIIITSIKCVTFMSWWKIVCSYMAYDNMYYSLFELEKNNNYI